MFKVTLIMEDKRYFQQTYEYVNNAFDSFESIKPDGQIEVITLHLGGTLLMSKKRSEQP